MPSQFSPSVAFFCPQSKAPTEAYLEQLQKYIIQTPLLQPFAEAIISLKDTWATLCKCYADIAKLTAGEQHVVSLEQWITEGIAGPVSSSMSGILALPLLVIIQICQYLQVLDLHNLTHDQMLESLKNGGGAQGYCGGLPTAFAIACAKDEEDVVRLATKAMRLAFAVGAFGELGDDESIVGSTTIAVRLRTSHQGEELIRGIPGVSYSLIVYLAKPSSCLSFPGFPVPKPSLAMKAIHQDLFALLCDNHMLTIISATFRRSQTQKR